MSDQEPGVVYKDRNAREKIELVAFWLAIGVKNLEQNLKQNLEQNLEQNLKDLKDRKLAFFR